MRVTERLAHCITTTNYEDLSEDSLLEAKKCFLDGIGVMLAGSRHEVTKVLRDYTAQIGGEVQATVFGTDSIKSSVVNSALINGAACHVLDFDDTHKMLGGHPTAVILPTVVTLGEYVKASGKEVLTAFVIGVEVSCRIASGINPYHYRSGYHVTSTVGIFGAAAAAGKLIGLSEEKLLYTLGIAGSMSSGLKENFGTMTKSLHIGLAASNGIKAALLAQKGCTASQAILEADMGFCKVLSRDCRFVNIIDKLGDPWVIVDPGIRRKKYPCCARTHSAIDGVLKVVSEHPIPIKDLTEIECATDDSAFEILIHPTPNSELEAKFSMPFCLAIAFLEKGIFLHHFTQNKINDPIVVSVMKKVKHISDSEINSKGYEYQWTSKVKITLSNGTEFFEVIEKPKGDPQNPLTCEELIEKFSGCVKGILDAKQVDSIVDRIKRLEDEKDISVLVADLVTG